MRIRSISIALTASVLLAQEPGGGPSTPVLISPDLLSDRRVTFRFFAPQAREVSVFFERDGKPLTKSPDGVWQATIGPLDAGSYRYGFAVDGASVTDPRNIETERMQLVARSILHVPGEAFMDARNVPHGAVAQVTYESSVLKKARRFHIYTPPGYEASQQKYPVLYLLHGANESDDSWSTVGRARFILDNLIADGEALPMIVVMPNGHIDQAPPNLSAIGTSGARLPLRGEFEEFPKEFAADILPHIDSHYRTVADRSHRAVAGLSMGGTQTLNIAFANLDKFSAIGVFSSGILGGTVAAWETEHLEALNDPALKHGLKTFWFSTGSGDFLLANSKATVGLFKKHGFDTTFQESSGAHTWVNWRNCLREFAPWLFR